MKISCKSVLGGWQTLLTDSIGREYLFGPVFNSTVDLWNWQKTNNIRGEK